MAKRIAGHIHTLTDLDIFTIYDNLKFLKDTGYSYTSCANKAKIPVIRTTAVDQSDVRQKGALHRIASLCNPDDSSLQIQMDKYRSLLLEYDP